MLPSKMKISMTILHSNGGKFNPTCLIALKGECRIIFSQFIGIMFCVIVTMYHSETFDFLPGDWQNYNTANETRIATIEDVWNEVDVYLNAGMHFYLLCQHDSDSRDKCDEDVLLECARRHRNRFFRKRNWLMIAAP